MIDIAKYIRTELDQLLEGTPYYLVEMVKQPNKKIEIFVDGEDGIDLEKCTKISRHILHKIDEESGYERNFVIEVSSPGLDRPFNNIKQYKKNINRKLEITLDDGKVFEAKLMALHDKDIEVIEQVIKGNRKWKQDGKTIILNINNIKHSKVLVSF